MASPALVLAAQTNGRKSRGPKTTEGKRRSAANSRKHGLFSRNLPLDDEYEQQRQTFHAALTAEFQPADALEAAEIYVMAEAHARSLWALRAFTSLISQEMLAQSGPKHNPDDDMTIRAHVAFVSQSAPLDRLLRHHFRANDQHYKASNRLKQKITERTESRSLLAAAPFARQSPAENERNERTKCPPLAPSAAPQKMSERTECPATPAPSHLQETINRTEFTPSPQSAYKNLLSNPPLAFPKLTHYTEISGNAPQLHRPNHYDRRTPCSKHYGRSIRPRLRLGQVIKIIRGHQRGRQTPT